MKKQVWSNAKRKMRPRTQSGQFQQRFRVCDRVSVFFCHPLITDFGRGFVYLSTIALLSLFRYPFLKIVPSLGVH